MGKYGVHWAFFNTVYVVCCSRKEYRIFGVCRLLPIALEGFGKDGGMALFRQACLLKAFIGNSFTIPILTLFFLRDAALQLHVSSWNWKNHFLEGFMSRLKDLAHLRLKSLEES